MGSFYAQLFFDFDSSCESNCKEYTKENSQDESCISDIALQADDADDIQDYENQCDPDVSFVIHFETLLNYKLNNSITRGAANIQSIQIFQEEI